MNLENYGDTNNTVNETYSDTLNYPKFRTILTIENNNIDNYDDEDNDDDNDDEYISYNFSQFNPKIVKLRKIRKVKKQKNVEKGSRKSVKSVKSEKLTKLYLDLDLELTNLKNINYGIRKQNKIIKENPKNSIQQKRYKVINNFLKILPRVISDIIHSYIFDILGERICLRDFNDDIDNIIDSNNNYIISRYSIDTSNETHLTIFDRQLKINLITFKYAEGYVDKIKILKDDILFIINEVSMEFWDIKTCELLYGMSYGNYVRFRLLSDEKEYIQIISFICYSHQILIFRFQKKFIDNKLVLNKSNTISYTKENQYNLYMDIISDSQFIRFYHSKDKERMEEEYWDPYDKLNSFEISIYNEDAEEKFITKSYIYNSQKFPNTKYFKHYFISEEGIYISGAINPDEYHSKNFIALIDKSSLVLINEIIIPEKLEDIIYIGNSQFLCTFRITCSRINNNKNFYIINFITGKKQLYLGNPYNSYSIYTKLDDGQIAIVINYKIIVYNPLIKHVTKTILVEDEIYNIKLKNKQLFCRLKNKKIAIYI